MIIDAHAHVDAAPAYGLNDTPEKLVRMMDRAGVAKAAISCYRNTPGHSPGGLETIADAVSRYPQRLIGYARLDPWFDGECIAALEYAVRRLGLRGVKLHPATYVLYPFNELTVKLVRRAGELGCPVLIHCGDENMCLPYQLDHLAAQSPGTTIILAHMGGFFHGGAALDVAERRGNILLDTSEIPCPDRIRRAVDRLGAEKVLFGTDAPCCDPRLELLKVELASLKACDKRRVLGGNMAKLMGIASEVGDDDHC